MRTFEMDIFEYMDTVIDKFFTELDEVITYEEPEEEEEEEEEEPEEEDDSNPWALTEKEQIAYNKYDDDRGAWDL